MGYNVVVQSRDMYRKIPDNWCRGGSGKYIAGMRIQHGKVGIREAEFRIRIRIHEGLYSVGYS